MSGDVVCEIDCEGGWGVEVEWGGVDVVEIVMGGGCVGGGWFF